LFFLNGRDLRNLCIAMTFQINRRSFLHGVGAAATLTLSPGELEALDAVFPKGAAAGERYAAGGMAIVNR
jgi:hypothetical protein